MLDGVLMSHKFITKPEDVFQKGRLFFEKGHIIKPHYHKYGTKENLTIIEGRCRVDIYDFNITAHKNKGREKIISKWNRIVSVELCSGNTIFIEGAGHGFEMYTDVVMDEVKQGPYREDDKVFI